MVAVTLQSGIHDAQIRSWVYVPVTDAQDAQSWAEDTVVVVQEAIDPTSFILAMNAKTLPYHLRTGRTQYFRVYIIRPAGEPNIYGLFFHGTHALMDAKPTLAVFSLLLKLMTISSTTDIIDIQWGREIKNLPVGPVTALGGPRDDWDTVGADLFALTMRHRKNPLVGGSLSLDRASVVDQRRTVYKSCHYH